MIAFQDIAPTAPATTFERAAAEMMADDALDLLDTQGRVDQGGLRRMGWRQAEIDEHGAEAMAIVGRKVAARCQADA